MNRKVAQYATNVNQKVSYSDNDESLGVSYRARMGRAAKIKAPKAPPRIHFLAEWLEHRRMKQVDLLSRLQETYPEANKSTISRWCNGALPSERYLLAIAKLLKIEPNRLFHHPADAEEKVDGGETPDVNVQDRRERLLTAVAGSYIVFHLDPYDARVLAEIVFEAAEGMLTVDAGADPLVALRAVAEFVTRGFLRSKSALSDTS